MLPLISAASLLIMPSSSSSPPAPSSLNIYLARHGQDQDNAASILNGHRNQPLTSIGIRQASTVAEKIRSAGLTFDAIYSSPLQRAHQTALIIASEGQCLGSECRNRKSACDSESAVQVMDQLIERDFGIMTGVPAKEIRSRCSGPGELLLTDTISYFLKPEGAETFPDLIERANGVIEDIRQQHEGRDESVLLPTAPIHLCPHAAALYLRSHHWPVR